MRADDLILISVDDHIAEPASMFDAHVPAKYREFTPRVVEEESGAQQWYYGGLRGRNLGLNAVAGKPPEMFNIDASRYDEMRPGCYDVHERVRDMSAGGQLAGLNFPNWTGFSGQVLNQGPDRDVNLIMIKAYNDWHVDEWCGAYPERFIPCGILPLYDVEEAAKEIHRLAAKGCHAVTFSENPEALSMPSIHTDYWYPLFRAASDVGTVLCLHVGSSSRAPLFSSDAPPSVNIAASSMMSAYSLLELVWAEFWADFPDLRFSLTEGDIGWIPYFLWRSEHVRRRHSGWARPTFPAGMDGPSDVFRRHILTCFISDRVGARLLDWFALDNVCWESDFPHSDSSWPFGPEDVLENLGELPDDTINKITHENAMRHYQFDPFRHRPRERCTAGALRAEAADVDVVTHVGRLADQRDRDAWARMTAPRAKA
ncbi:Predicted metal-dependent hydrolase, TIM-barrel fold [Parafrankia irregularis]|uniref:Predicted metal-dependent hydrolase, TIM-barrel fold n=1 Tax=Parafrankia irregularis TaxID=795642 RepID=A0A0S4QLQ6_9ACTN|nr:MULTISPECIES: amidohydrolase family protein [Parafrankia]MBE3201306.1 amidohydrolase family protein [Parafrankia sp. CH37]CUU56244.1 Predicted metal-dependent hydrolase, TIM-barrel fold [Parafrankia irregularis]